MKTHLKSSERTTANALTLEKLELGMSKEFAKKHNLDVIRSLNSFKKFRSHVTLFLEFRSELRLPLAGPYPIGEMYEYLQYLVAEDCDQRYLNSTKRALELVFRVKLPAVESLVSVVLKPRSYSNEELHWIHSRLSEASAFSTRLAAAAGLRAHELHTLRPASEQAPSPKREWRTDLFIGMEGFQKYAVTGKGGLTRHVAIPNHLAVQLEATRLQFAETVADRGIKYKSVYAVPGGQSLSQAFSTASQQALGFSNGLHGVRHTYAKERLATLRKLGVSSKDALLIISQELGHFRPKIVLTYLR